MLCVGWRLGVDFVVMVGSRRLEGKEVGTFSALNLPSLKSPDPIRPDPIELRSGGISSTCIDMAYPICANPRTPLDAGLSAMKQAQKPENENSFATL